MNNTSQSSIERSREEMKSQRSNMRTTGKNIIPDGIKLFIPPPPKLITRLGSIFKPKEPAIQVILRFHLVTCLAFSH